MHNHAPAGYACPICAGIAGNRPRQTLLRKGDIAYQDALVTAFIGSFFFGSCRGNVIVVPNKHFENIFDMPPEYLSRVIEVTQLVSAAMMETYGCDGIMLLQNNGPASGQHALHFHQHIFPRFEGDNLMDSIAQKYQTTPRERLDFARWLRAKLMRKELTHVKVSLESPERIAKIELIQDGAILASHRFGKSKPWNDPQKAIFHLLTIAPGTRIFTAQVAAAINEQNEQSRAVSIARKVGLFTKVEEGLSERTITPIVWA